MSKLDFKKAEDLEIKLPTSTGSLKKEENSRKTSTSASLTMLKVFDYVDHKKLENFSRDGNNRAPHLPPEKPVCGSRSNRTRYGTTDYFKIGKGLHQGCILSPCIFNLYVEYFIQNAGRDTNNLRYTDVTTLTGESKEELKSLLMMVKEESEKLA